MQAIDKGTKNKCMICGDCGYHNEYNKEWSQNGSTLKMNYFDFLV